MKKTIELICKSCQIPTIHTIDGFMMKGNMRRLKQWKGYLSIKQYACLECKSSFYYKPKDIIETQEAVFYTKR